MKLITDLEQLLGKKNVKTGGEVGEVDNGYFYDGFSVAMAIVYPGSTQDVSDIMKLCHAADQKVLVQGGKTGLVRGHIAEADEIVIAMDKMTAIEDIDKVGRTATVQAGCILENLQKAAENEGLCFPLDLGGRGSCTIGGNISTNAGGIRVIKYGMMREQVLGLEAVLADGTIISSMNSVIKNNTGYDIKQFFIGAEGTLGIVTRAVLRLRPQMSTDHLAMVAMESFQDVLETIAIADEKLGGQMTAYEVMANNYYRHAITDDKAAKPMDDSYAYYVLIESQGIDDESDRQLFNDLLEYLFEQGKIVDGVIAKSEREVAEMWNLRENILPFYDSQSPTFAYDVSVPLPRMVKYMADVNKELKQVFPNGGAYLLGHVGDGNLHIAVRPFCEGDLDELHKKSSDLIYNNLKSFKGVVSAEHGIGFEKKDYLSVSRSEDELALMHGLKTMMDPKNLLGAGRIF